ncbi:hypothetical protein BKA67DRAFT_533981 [Truncatella angustata]|uniref:Nephrocystin 3-like N-terminal domain-containing protein n=1 Tax=Truncatella angustata TaxID=152316 RepID=A0A9P8UMX6_9PEZI|nr:uncharacterized protein BKA67DRAFT_533981 [Truncatella angustata]KAH6655033.1 hypothetical protein BKA67DRAFT_533981 [Truncatella angustata]
MAPNSHNSNSSNYADNGARQFNQIFNLQLYRPWSPFAPDIALEMFTRDHHEVEELGSAAQQFLYGQVVDRRSSISQGKGSSSNPVFCFLKDGCFSETCYFDVDLDKCLAHYPTSRSAKQVMDILNNTQVQVLSSWIKSKESAVLLLDRYIVTKSGSCWTTDFTLEVIGRITHSNGSIDASQRPSAVVTYFCDERLRAGQWRQDIVVQDFLIQLCRARNDFLQAHHDCGALQQTQEIFHKRPTGTSELWHLFQSCVTAAGIKTLYVLLDNVDSIHDRSSSSKFEDFTANLRTLLVTCQEKSIPVKLLVTSRLDRTKAYFRNFGLSVGYIKLDYPPQRRLPY